MAQLKETLAEQDADIESVARLVALVKQIREGSSNQLEVRDVIEAVETMKANGISPDSLHEALPYITAIAEQEGAFDPDTFSKIAQASQKFGGLSKTLQAMNAFGKLEDIEEKTEEKRQELKEAQEELKNSQQEFQKVQANLSLYHKLEAKGYDTDYLQKFDQFVRKYGRGKLMSEQFLENVVSRYSGVDDIAAREAELRSKAGEAEP